MINSAYTAFNGIKVSQTQIEVSMNNIANESTEGYKKRNVIVEEIGLMGSPQGHGSKVGDITRAVDVALNNNVMKTTGKFNYIDTQKTILAPIDELSLGGVSDDSLKDLRDAFSLLKNTPEDPAYRVELKGKTDLFAYSTNNFMSTLDNANHESAKGAENSVAEINMISKKISRINEAMGINSQPPLDLLDKRDALEKELSKYVKFTTDTNNGEYSLKITGSDTPLIAGRRYQELGVEINTITKQYTNRSGNTYDYNLEIATLKFGIVDNDVKTGDTLTLQASQRGKLLAQLDYAKEGSDLEGGKLMMISFLSNLRDDILSKDSADTPTKNMSLYNIDFTASGKNGTKNSEYITTGLDSEFDKTDKAMVDGIMALFGEETVSLVGATESMTLREQENYIRTAMHNMYHNKNEMSKVEKSVVDMYEAKYDKLIKVDSSEEMINVMKYQAAYQAGAKMVQVVDEMIQTLLGMKR